MIQKIIILIIIITIVSSEYEIRNINNGNIYTTCKTTCIKYNQNNKEYCISPITKINNINDELNNVSIICSYENNCNENSCKYYNKKYNIFETYCINKNNRNELNLCNSYIGKINNKIYICKILPCKPYSELNLEKGILKENINEKINENKIQHVYLHLKYENINSQDNLLNIQNEREELNNLKAKLLKELNDKSIKDIKTLNQDNIIETYIFIIPLTGLIYIIILLTYLIYKVNI